jgi:hypothetical protein
MLRALKAFLGTGEDGLYRLAEAPHGLASTRPIRKGQKIMMIPRRCIIEASVIPFRDESVDINSRLAWYIAREAVNKKSPWRAYLASMPSRKDLLGHPMFLNGSDADALRATSVGISPIGNIYTYMDSIIRDHEIIRRKKPFGFVPSLEDFLYYRVLVSSRNFGYERGGVEESGLVPYADLLNHSPRPNTVWYFDDASCCFVVEATKNIRPGTEICDSYGTKPNNELFLYYGFTIPNNPNRIDPFSINDSPDARHCKKAWLKKTKNPDVRRLLSEELRA